MASGELIRHQVTIAGVVTLDSGEAAGAASVDIISGPAKFMNRITTLRAVLGPAFDGLAARPDRATVAVDGLYYFLDLPDGAYELAATIPGAGQRFGSGSASATVAHDVTGNAVRAEANMIVPSTALSGRVVDATTAYGAQIRAEPSLVSRWRLGDASGPAHDDVGGRDANPAGSLTRAVPSLLVVDDDAATGFTGAGYLEVPFVAALNASPFSIEAWARVSGGSGTERSVLTSRDNSGGAPFRGWQLEASPGNTWQFVVGDGTQWKVLAGPAVALGTTVHLVGTYDGTNAQLFVDGTVVATSPVALMANAQRPLRIGAGATEGAATAEFVGVIDEVAIYDAALAPSRVAAHYALGSSSTAGQGVSIAWVTLNGSGERALSASDGTFRLGGIEPGTRQVGINAAGYAGVTLPMMINFASDTSLVAVLDKAA